MSEAGEAALSDRGIFGWRLRSDRPLPLLAAWDGAASHPVDIEILSGSVPPFETGENYTNPLFDVHRDGRVIVHPPDGPRILVENGRRMVVDDCGVSDMHLHAWLFGTGIGALCHQRGQPPLHAAVLEIGGHGVALAGDTGAGKSTTARALVARGHRLLSDDLGVMDATRLVAQPGFPSMKLCVDSAERFGDSIDPAMSVSDAKDKFYVALPDGFRAEPVQLALLVVLKADAEVERPVAWRVPPTRAASLVHRFVYRRQVGMALDEGRGVFAFATNLARTVPAVVVSRPDDVGKIDELCTLIEDLADGRALAA